MANRKDAIVAGEYYHLYNRGNNKAEIFFDDGDRDRFLKLLYLCNSSKEVNFREYIAERKIDTWDFDRGEPIVSIGAWVLMPNHFHIYIIENLKVKPNGREMSNISIFMRKLGTAYSKYLNAKYARTGSPFEGTFRSVFVENDTQARYLFSYIHLNPVKLLDAKWKINGVKNTAATLKFLKSYWWSSYLDYLGVERKENVIICQKDFPDYFLRPTLMEREIFDWLKPQS